MFKIGKITNTHGIKGEVKVHQTTDFDERFAPGEKVYKKDETGEQELTVVHARPHKQYLIVQFEGFSSINDVESWKGQDLYIKESQQEELGDHEYYYHEIIGCETVTTDGEVLGVIDSILAPGANDVWVVKTENGREILIPYIADVVKEVDVPNKKVTIELMEGLVD